MMHLNTCKRLNVHKTIYLDNVLKPLYIGAGESWKEAIDFVWRDCWVIPK